MHRKILTVILLLLWSPAAFAGGLALKFHTAMKITTGQGITAAGKDISGKTTEQEEDETVTLFPQAFTVRTGALEKIYDFTARRLIEIDRDKKTFAEHSLYALPVFMARERQNRIVLNEVFKKTFGKGSKNQSVHVASGVIVSDVDLDMILGTLSTEKSLNALQTSVKDGTTSVSGEGRELARFALSETKIPDDLRTSYARFVVYQMTMHPQIKKIVYTSGDLFKTLHYSLRDGMRATEQDWTLTGSEQAADTALVPPPGYTQVFSDNPDMNAAMENAANKKAPSAEEFATNIAAYTAKGDRLRAMLAALEMTIVHGPDAVRAEPASAQALRESEHDPAASATFAAITTVPRSDDDFRRMVASLDAAASAAPDFKWLLELYEANHAVTWLRTGRKIPAGQVTTMHAAEDRLAQAIIADPFLTGAYCDLGQASFMNYEMSQAWDLWDQARRVNPEYPALHEIAGIEERAAKDFAEYF